MKQTNLPGQTAGFGAEFLRASEPVELKQGKVFSKPEEIVEPVLRLDFRYSCLNNLVYERWNSGYL